ncbi:hypothetical protein BOTBODRAFT_36043 [Botryobasidium botryosum FD-172 SS1]|uniref:Uncharacterized protein n=1 Tax=Botryobasidium botryosum (strain FD-172 SS1) TaxID=930990 RepID=A0A067M588_BOTB1|nr:hypothetical protein BOTBODRAFT_36043 [Botryobasidium botryosum FD-172 SS1]
MVLQSTNIVYTPGLTRADRTRVNRFVGDEYKADWTRLPHPTALPQRPLVSFERERALRCRSGWVNSRELKSSCTLSLKIALG